MLGEHSPASATQKPKHRQNMARPGQPTPGKSRPNHSQKHAWRAFPSQRHPEAKTSTKHGPARSADTWKKSSKPSPKACLESIPRPAPPRSQNIDKTWPGPVSRHLEKVVQTIPKSMLGEHSPASATQKPKHRQNMARPGQPTPGKSRPNHPQKHAWRAFPGQRHPEAKTSTKHGPARSADTWKKSSKPSPKACLESIPWPAPPRSQNIDKTWPGPVSRHLEKVVQTIPKSVVVCGV